jgi:hypothetical protein
MLYCYNRTLENGLGDQKKLRSKENMIQMVRNQNFKKRKKIQ